MSKSTTNGIKGFIAGAAAGTLTGMLIAPDKGRKTRKKIKKTLGSRNPDPGQAIEDYLSDLKQGMEDFIKDFEMKLDHIEAQMESQKQEVNPGN